MRNPEENSVANRQAQHFLKLAADIASTHENSPTEARVIAAMAKSLRATLGRHAGGDALTRNEARDIVELVEMLATTVAYLLERD